MTLWRDNTIYRSAVWEQAKQAARVTSADLRPYRHDPVAFVHDFFVWGEKQSPTPYQCDIMTNLAIRKRAAVRGPHGLGKTALAAWIVLWFALTRDGEDWKVPTTAGSWRQLTRFLWPEIGKWARRLRWDKLKRSPFDGRRELQSQMLRLTTGEAFAVAARQYDLIEGAHADQLLYVYDESKAIQDQTFDASEGAFSGAGDDTGQDAYALAISTPGDINGRFYDIHSRKPGYEDWWTRHVTLEECIGAGRVSRAWAEQRARQWGVKSQVYQNRVLGEFSGAGHDSVIPLAYVEMANERWAEWQEELSGNGRFVACGVDVGGGGEGGDASTIADLYDLIPVEFDGTAVAIGKIDSYILEDTMSLTGRVIGRLDRMGRLWGGGYSVIDANGIGLGSLQRGRELGRDFRAFVAQAGSDETDASGELGFADLRSAAWWKLRELLEPTSSWWVALPPDDDLIGELVAPKSRVDSGGRIRVESKEDIRRRLGKSTDKADPVVQVLHEYRIGGSPGQFDPGDAVGQLGDEDGDDFEERWS